MKGKPTSVEREVAYTNGEVTWWEVTFEPACDEGGQIIGVSYNATDITARKQCEDKIVVQNASLRQIAYIQSHELGKLVTSILGLVDLFLFEDYPFSREDLRMLGEVTAKPDQKIRQIIGLAD